MTVQERTEGGYTKGVDKNGNTFYRDPNGHPVKQQSYAGSKGGKATAEKYDTIPEFDDEGNFSGGRKEPKEPPTPPPPPREPVTRVVATLKKDTDNTRGFVTNDSAIAKLEISGTFRRGEAPTDDQIKRRMNDILEATTGEDSGGFQMARETEFNVEKAPGRGSPHGWRSIGNDLDIEFTESGNEYDYDVDANQMEINDF